MSEEEKRTAVEISGVLAKMLEEAYAGLERVERVGLRSRHDLARRLLAAALDEKLQRQERNND